MLTHPLNLASAPAREFVQLLRDAVIVTDAEFRVQVWNGASEKLYGWTAGEALGRNGTELLRTEFPEGNKETRLRAIRETGFYRGEATQATKDGRRIPVEVDSLALKDSEGRITGYLSFNRDISEWKREQERLEQYGKFLEMLANYLPGMVGYWDASMRCGFANKAYQEWFGRDPAAMLGIHMREFLGEKVFALNEPYVQRALAGEPQRFERKLILPDGSIRFSLAHYVPHSRKGQTVGFFAFVSDLTAQKLAEIRLQETLDVQKALSENTAFALIKCDTEGIIRFINPAAAQLLGYAPEELVGVQSPSIFHDVEEVAARAAEFSRELGRPVAVGFETFVIKSILGLPNEHEWTYVRKDGRRVPVLLGVTAIRDSEGKITGFLGTAADITKRKRLEAELREAITLAESANRAKSEFLATMSHEIRTPLNGVLGLAQLLLDTPLGPEQREYVRVMGQSGGLLLSIISDILDYSKIEAGKMEIESAVFDLGQAISEVANILSLRAHEKGLYLKTALKGDGTVNALGDPGRVRQILMNLVGNALKFTDNGGVEIRGSIRDGLAQVEVSDTGPGIRAENHDRVFRKFSQEDASTTRRFGGTGLGLAISKGLAEKMGGSLSFISAVGEGSTFRFALPAAAAPMGKGKQEVSRGSANPDAPVPGHVDTLPPEEALAALSSLRVLVVEDNAVNRMVAEGLFRKIGCQVELVANGEDALAKLRESRFDAVFMDCQMPVMDGFEATRLIRAWEAGRSGNPRVPIIALTANAFADDRERCLAAGMDDFLTKPMRKADIVRLLCARFPTGSARPPQGTDRPPLGRAGSDW